MKNNPTPRLTPSLKLRRTSRITGKTLLCSLFILLFSCSANCANKEHVRQLRELHNKEKDQKILNNADVSFVDLKNINLADAVLDKADFSKSDIAYGNFENARLRDAVFASSNLPSANFENADLSNANLSSYQASLSIIGHEITEPSKKLATELKNTFDTTKRFILQKFPKEEASNLLGCLKKDIIATLIFLNKSVLGTANKLAFPMSLNLVGGNRNCANFRTATADGADFSYTFLTGASFVDSSLINANFEHCMLSCADFSGADLTGANLEHTHVEGADFRGVVGLSEEQKVYLRDHGAIVD